MNKKELIIITAANLIHEKGYHHVGIKSILDELSIPKGSFYHYFKSKEDLGLAIIDFYIEDLSQLLNNSNKDLDGIKAVFDQLINRLVGLEFKCGCPIGNLILELSDENEIFRAKLMEWYSEFIAWIEEVLESASVEEPLDKAKALVASFEGTVLVSKLEKDRASFDIFYKYMFNTIIQQ